LAKASLLLLFLPFVFLSCEDELSTIGFKPDQSRFNVSYVEIDLPSSVFRPASVPTFNRGNDGVTPRILVGSYQDNDFGKVTAEGLFQIRPSSSNAESLPDNAVLESLKLILSFDHYHYGDNSPVNIDFYVHELTDSLITEAPYYNSSVIDYSPTVIGTGSYGVTQSIFDERYALNNDTDATNDANTYDTLVVELSSSYAEALFQFAKENSADYKSFRKFRRMFKGLAIRSNAINQIVGFNPSYSYTAAKDSRPNRSRLELNYRYTKDDGSTAKDKIEFVPYADGSNNGSISFSKITAERTGTSLQEIDQNYKSFYPAGDKRFVSAGDPILTSFDISNFFSFADTVNNLLINSAELVIDPIETSVYTPPASLKIRPLNTANRFKSASDTIASQYGGVLVNDVGTGYSMIGEGSGNNVVARTIDLKKVDNVSSYKGSFTRYFQALYAIKDPKLRLLKYAMIPNTPSIGKSMNRFLFDKNKLKLRIYYTTPSTKKEE
jgi:Domain of unknown function (DUF4270)